MAKFETKTNKKQEHEVAMAMEKHFGCKMLEMPEFSACDYISYLSGEAIALIEVRVRSKEYETFFFAEKKRISLLTLSELLRLPAYMAVKLPDRLTFIDVSKEPCKREYGGRNDIRVEQDREWLVHYKLKG